MRDLQSNIKIVDTITDALGKPIDNEIKPCIAALWTIDFDTDNSCEGHFNIRNGGPFVWVQAPGLDKQIERLHTLKPVGSEEYMTVLNVISAENLKSQTRLLRLLAEFYEDRKTKLTHRIIIATMAMSKMKLTCQGAASVNNSATDEEYRGWVEEARQEFIEFGDFLIDKIKQEK